MTFETLNLAPALLKAVSELGYKEPTPIQKEAIPIVLGGADLMAAAQTGTGKTGAFALPILQTLSQEEPARNHKKKVIPRAVILAPTRELAAQIEESFRDLGKHLALKTVVIYGGVSMNPQIQRLQRGVDIIVATPGRLLDLQNQGFVDLSKTQTLVLDEADRMLDMGFIIDIQKIIDLMPEKRQNLLFSATFSNEIRELATRLLHDPHTIDVTPRNSTVELIEQVAYPVSRARKLELLIQLIQENQWYQVLVFTRTKSGANKVADVLERSGIKTGALHGSKSQAARTRAMKDLKDGRIQVLVATDIAARGIDIEQLACVINFELPNVSEDYVHRIGRTGRAGSEGIAISLVTVDEAGFLQQIETFIKREIEQVEIEGFTPPESEKAMPIVMGRQVIWGGIGRAPSGKSMNAFVKSERQNFSRPRRPSSGGGGGGRSAGGRAGQGAGSGRGRPERSGADAGAGGRGRPERSGADAGAGGRGRPERNGADAGAGRSRPGRSSADAGAGGGRSRPGRSGADAGAGGGRSRPGRSSADAGAGSGNSRSKGRGNRSGFRVAKD